MSQPRKTKQNYSTMTLQQVMQLVGKETILSWNINVSSRPPSAMLVELLQRFDSFDLLLSEPAKTLLVDAMFVEIVPLHPTLKVWKEALLSTDTITGVADYLIAPKRAYIETPLLCVAEAKKDDFVKGSIQCIAEMVACRWSNQQSGLDVDVYGVVSNGQGWQFYKLTMATEILGTGLYTIDDLPKLLGTLDYICGECAKNVP